MSGVVGEDSLDIPGDSNRKISFFVGKDTPKEWRAEGTLLYCRKATLYHQGDSHGIVVHDAVIIGTMPTEPAKKKWTIDRLPLEAGKIEDHKIAVWQIPPKQ
jgi:hypothetical protein